MVTTRSQDKMTFADKIRAKGFSLADCKFFKLNALFPIMLGLAHATVALWCGSGLAAAVVGACAEINQCVGCTGDTSSLSHFSAITRPTWLGRAVRNRDRHAIEQASRRWRGGRRERAVKF